MDTALSALIRLNQFSTGRRLYTFHRVLAVAKKMQASTIEALAQKAIAADDATYTLELRWASQRRSGKPSAKQVKAQRALQKLDSQVDKALSGLRDSAMALIRGADDDERELIDAVEHFLDAVFPNGVQAVTSKTYDQELVAVKAIVAKLEGDLAPNVQKLGLSVNVERLAKLAIKYDEAQRGADSLEFGAVKAARAAGQEWLLRLAAKIMGTYDGPDGEHAQKRAALLGPVVAQNEAISEHIRSRRSVPDVDPSTGEEQLPEPGAPADEAKDAGDAAEA